MHRPVPATTCKSRGSRESFSTAARTSLAKEMALDLSVRSKEMAALPPSSQPSEEGKNGNYVKVNAFYENLGLTSMNFRDGTRMTMYKDNAFKVPMSEKEVEESAFEDLFGDQGEEEDDEDAVFEEDDIDDGDEDDSDDEDDDDVQRVLDSDLLRTIIEDEAARRIATVGIRDEVDEIPLANIRIEPTRRKSRSRSSRMEEDETISSAGDLSIDPTSIDIIPLRKAKAEKDGAIDNDIDNDINIDDLKKSILSDPTLQQQDINDYTTDTMPPLLAASSGSFVNMFRGSASYIANHRGTITVYHIPGELLAWEGFPGLMDDIALTWLLGMKIVLVAGCRHQIDLRLEEIKENEEMDQYDDGHSSLGDHGGDPPVGKPTSKFADTEARPETSIKVRISNYCQYLSLTLSYSYNECIST